MWIRPMLVSDIEAIKQLEKDIFGDAWSEDYRVLAYIIFRVNDDEAELFRIATDKCNRGMGCGHRLMNFMISNLRDMKVKKVFLEVRCQNKDAIRLYEEYGFKKLGIRKEYYHDPIDDALLMEGYIKC